MWSCLLFRLFLIVFGARKRHYFRNMIRKLLHNFCGPSRERIWFEWEYSTPLSTTHTDELELPANAQSSYTMTKLVFKVSALHIDNLRKRCRNTESGINLQTTTRRWLVGALNAVQRWGPYSNPHLVRKSFVLNRRTKSRAKQSHYPHYFFGPRIE